MDPPQKWNPALISESSQLTAAGTSQEGAAASRPSSSEQLMMGLGDPRPRAGTSHPAPLPEGLLQQRYREEKSPQERRWERLAFPQRKKAFLGHVRRRHRDHMAPYPVEREPRISPSGNRDQNRFRCECRYCQSHRPTLPRMPGGEERGPSCFLLGDASAGPQRPDPQPGDRPARPSARRGAPAAGERGEVPTGEAAGEQEGVPEAAQTVVRGKM
ncbi:protein FAM156A/FAM156B, partial [Daubentonia madagascariensis]